MKKRKKNTITDTLTVENSRFEIFFFKNWEPGNKRVPCKLIWTLHKPTISLKNKTLQAVLKPLEKYASESTQINLCFALLSRNFDDHSSQIVTGLLYFHA